MASTLRRPPVRRSTDVDASPDASSVDLRPPRPTFAVGSRNSWSSSDFSDPERPFQPTSRRASIHRRTSFGQDSIPPTAQASRSFPAADPFKDDHVPNSPPSSFAWPFQAYPGNPDPIPSYRRLSLDSIRLRERSSSTAGFLPTSAYSEVQHALFQSSNPDLRSDFARPNPPFAFSDSRESAHGISTVYRASAAAALSSSPHPQYPFPNLNRPGPFRPPFLSPASRPSSIWQPPSYPNNPINGSNHSLPLRKSKPPMPSSKLSSELTAEDKHWLNEKDKRLRISWWLTVFFWFLGACGGGVLCYFGWNNVRVLSPNQLCPVFTDNFDTFDTSIWTKDVELGGFGNGEFQMTTDSSKNLYILNGELYIDPSLTSDEIGAATVLDGGNYTLSGCTTTNGSACSVSSNSHTNSVINPVQSARISTIKSYSTKYGKVEVRAKLPRGDWLWPAIWMLPVNNTYGSWPASGEIDIMEARGNSPSYPAQGTNYVRSSLNYGPLSTAIAKIYGWQSQKRSSYDQGFHIYTLEWTDSWMRVSVDSKNLAMLDVNVQGTGGKSFWDRGNFPPTAQNGSSQVVVNKIYQTPSAPFDQNFYLILDLAAGGTSGWFPDNVGGKPWYDGSATAMSDFARAQSTWASTWPTNADDRAFRIDYVKMWSLC